MVSVSASKLPSLSEDSNSKYTLTTDTVPSWSSRFEERLISFNTRFGVTTQWLAGTTVRKSITTPLKSGIPISVCLATIARLSDEENESASLCVGLPSALYVCTPESEALEIPLQYYTPDFHLTNLFPLYCGLLVEFSAGEGADLRRRYYTLLHPDEELIRVTEIDERERVIFSSRDIPLIVTRNHRYLKVWATLETPPEGQCISDSQSKVTDSEENTNNGYSALQLCSFQSVLQLRLVHIQTEDSRRSSSAPPSATAFLVHDLREQIVLCLTSCGTLSVFNVGFSSGVIDSVTLAYRIDDVMYAAPIFACRRGNNLMDTLVQHASGDISLYIAQNRLCEVELTQTQKKMVGNVKLALRKKRVLKSESVNVFQVRSDDGHWSRFMLCNVSFGSALVSQCIAAISCAFDNTDCLPQIIFFYQEMLRKLQTSSLSENEESVKHEWDVFVDVLMQFPKHGNGRRNSVPTHATSSIEELSDWEFLLKTDQKILHRDYHLLPTTHSTANQAVSNTTHAEGLTSEYKLIITRVLNALHLIYEDRKLSTLLAMDVKRLADANRKLALFVGNSSFLDYYRRENGYVLYTGLENDILAGNCAHLSEVPSIFDHLARLTRGVQKDRFPELSFSKREAERPAPDLSKIANALTYQIEEFYRCLYLPQPSEKTKEERAENVLLRMTKHKFRRADLDALPFGVALPLQDALWMCRKSPNSSWSSDAFLLIDREDLLPVGPEPSLEPQIDGHCESLSLLRMQSIAATDSAFGTGDECSARNSNADSCETRSDKSDADDGCDMRDFIFKLRFGQDRRLNEVRRMLRSTTPVIISPNVDTGTAGESDSSEFEEKLLVLLQKRLASPVGRGAFTLRTFLPADPTKPLIVPKICTTGRLYGQKFAKLNLTDASAINTEWGQFHNGVASGLRLVAPDSSRDSDNVKVLTRSWIVRHKPTDISASSSHAGMLLALGLGGFLPALRNTDLYQYLLPRHDLTSIGLMIGLASGNRGSMHEKVTKMLQVHIRAFNEPGFSMPEFTVPVDVQTAAVLSLGLLYESSHKSSILEGLFLELTRCTRFGPEVDGREGLSLAAGIAIGMVCLGGGEPLVSISKGKLVDRLARFANGDLRDSTEVLSAREGRNTTKSSQENGSGTIDRSGLGDSDACRVSELSTVNIDVVAPGALLALGLMYLKSNDHHVADRIRIPENFYQLDRTRPDLVFLQVLARSLILWDEISPTLEWVKQCLPSILQSPGSDVTDSKLELLKTFRKDSFGRFLDLDVSAILSARAFAICGACTAIALRFAGTNDHDAVNVLKNACANFENALQTVKKDSEDTEWLYSTCLTSCSLALGVTCAGSGDLDVFRILRRLRKRAGPSLKSKRYGRYMGLDMSVGFLFLGGGCQTFGTSNSSIAALICSIYPKFPVSVTDNQYHLQAMRHLYVLAVEPRCIETRDVDTDSPCQVDLEVHSVNGTKLKLTAPCIVPASPSVKHISVVSERYLPTIISLKPAVDGRGWYSATKRQLVYVKRRPGHLSHLADPKGSKGILARSFGRTNANCALSSSPSSWEVTDMEHLVQAFSADPEILAFARLFCSQKSQIVHGKLSCSEQTQSEVSSGTLDAWRRYSQILCECLATDRADALRSYFDAERTVSALKRGTACPSMLGSILLSIEYLKNRSRDRYSLVSDHDLSFIISQACTTLESSQMNAALYDYIRSGGAIWPEKLHLGYALRCYRVPQPIHLQRLAACIRRLHKKNMPGRDHWLICSTNLPVGTSERAFACIARALSADYKQSVTS